MLALAVLSIRGSDLVGIGPFLEGILIGGHRFTAGLRSRLIAPDPDTAADAPIPISRACYGQGRGRTPRPPPRLEEQARCILVIIGATPEGRKELVGFTDGIRESSQLVA